MCFVLLFPCEGKSSQNMFDVEYLLVFIKGLVKDHMHEEFHGSVFFLLSAFGLHRHAHLKQDGERCDSAAGLDGFI